MRRGVATGAFTALVPRSAATSAPYAPVAHSATFAATVAADNKSVRLVIDGLLADRIHELTSSGVKSVDGLPLLHKEAYYTLNRIPK